jgi:cytochrome b
VVADDLLRAHELPGFVTVTQGAGALVTIVGALLLARRSIDGVAIFSSLGFAVAFLLAVGRLWLVTRPARARARHAADPAGARQRPRNLIGS